MGYPYAACLLAAFTIASLFACKTASTSNKTLEATVAHTAVDAGLDVNDVSVLLPLPDLMADTAKMLPLSAMNADGKPLVSEALFKDVIRHFKYDTTIDGVSVKFDAGIAFGDADPQRRASTRAGKGPFDKYEDWRIVGMRFDPCAPSLTFNRRQQPPADAPTAYDSAKCLLQIRLTAQPIVTNDQSGTDLRGDPNGPHAADYTMHLVYSLTATDAESMFHDLVDFRAHCGDLTSGMPQGIHPCLLAEKLAGTYAGPRFQEMLKIVQKYAKSIVGLSSMGTRNSTDPWIFMNGVVQNDQYQHVPIDAIHKDRDVLTNSRGRILEPFYNGYFQMVSFLNVQNAGQPANPVTPLPVDDKVHDAFNTELMKSKDPALQSLRYATRLNRLENPRHNDFFSADCVSCHSASELTVRSSPDFTFSGDDFAIELDGGGKVYRGAPAATEPEGTPFQKKYADPDAFKPGNGYTNIVDVHAMSATTTKFPYAFIHFGYLGAKPSISGRVTNESGGVAKTVNNFYAGGKPPPQVCATETMRSCMFSRTGLTLAQREGTPLSGMFATSYCATQVCPERAKSLEPVLRYFPVERYQVTDDLLLIPDDFRDRSDELPLTIAKGTVLIGRMKDLPSSGGNTTAVIELVNLIAAKGTGTGDDYTITRVLPLKNNNKAKLQKL